MSVATKRDLRAEARERVIKILDEESRRMPVKSVPTLLSDYKGSVIFPHEEVDEPDTDD